MISITDLTVAFGAVRPIDGLTLNIDSPAHGIIGPNGAGKTTLLNVISGLIVPDSGSIETFGTQLRHLAPRQRAKWGLRRTFQTEQLAEDLSGADNVTIALDHCGGRSSRSEAEACALVGLDRPERLVRDMTTSDRRLTEIARAIVGEPRLVLMDEPAAGVSSAQRDHLVDLLIDLPEKSGAWLVIIDHDVELISAVCETTTALDFGALISSGPTAETLADPAVVETYLGTPPGS